MLKFLYNKPLPKEIAKDRLKFIIVNDREGITPYILDIIKNEILTIVIKYINIDINNVSTDLYKSGDIKFGNNIPKLVVTIPLYQNCKK